jgi:hypothetical protein
MTEEQIRRYVAITNELGVCPSIAQLRWNRLNKLGT